MVLTTEQSCFIDRVMELQKGSIVLNSPAGTGKTFTISKLQLVMNNLPHDDRRKITVLAPTNKAKDVLISNNIMAITIHQFFKSEKKINDDGIITYPLSLPDINKYTNAIIIIDECSMINDEMFDLFEIISLTSLVIYAGDHIQLPPIQPKKKDDRLNEKVKSTRSKVFETGYETWEFTKNMRSKIYSSTIMLTKARDAVVKKIMPPSISSMTIDEILPYFEEIEDDSIILAYSNERVNFYNKRVREFLFCKDGSELQPYYINEVLIFTGLRTNNNGYRYSTGSTVIIKSLSTESITLNYAECDCDLETDFNRSLCKAHKFRYGSVFIKFYKIIDQNGITWYICHRDSLKAFKELSNQYLKICIMRKKSYIWKQYYDWIDLYSPDLKYRYSSTIHKSQGSQWRNVFVDRKNLIRCSQNDQLLKVNGYYTAISRMTTEVYDIE